MISLVSCFLIWSFVNISGTAGWLCIGKDVRRNGHGLF